MARIGGQRSVAIVGAGWAGLACAVELARVGHHVTVFEAGKAPGGRARSVAASDPVDTVDNGQHVLIGPYRDTFALMDRIGVDRRRVLRRLPLRLQATDGLRLSVPAWPLGLGGLVGVLGARGLGPGGRRALLRVARGVAAMLSAPDQTVGAWLEALQQPPQLVRRLWAPLCVAALNTPAERASAQVFARVLQDGLLAAGAAASIEVPARPLGELLPEPAGAWLRSNGADVCLACRVKGLLRASAGAWTLDTAHGESGPFDAVVVAVAPHQAADLVDGHADGETLGRLYGLEYEAIATVHLQLAAPLPTPATPLRLLQQNDTADGPGEWLVDHGDGRVSVVISAWRRDTALGAASGDGPTDGIEGPAGSADPLATAVAAQLRRLIPGLPAVTAARTLVEKRATFACTPSLHRPAHATGAAGLWLAGDYTAGAYPATLEGAVRSGIECARLAIAGPG